MASRLIEQVRVRQHQIGSCFGDMKLDEDKSKSTRRSEEHLAAMHKEMEAIATELAQLRKAAERETEGQVLGRLNKRKEEQHWSLGRNPSGPSGLV